MTRLAAALGLALLLALAGGFGLITAAEARAQTHSGSAQPIQAVALADLPPEARQTLNLIKRGGPFPFPRKDGSTFGNFEQRLPSAPRGDYREYTVPTPGSADRGPRRIIAGGGEYYYSGDHYRSFRRIRQP